MINRYQYHCIPESSQTPPQLAPRWPTPAATAMMGHPPKGAPVLESTSLLLGPVLRRVIDDRATVWVQTGHPATVTVRAGAASGSARTFTVFDRHYALVVVDGLPADAVTPYQVLLDGDEVWPPTDYPYPAPVIRTRSVDAPVRLVFGSCRQANPHTIPGLPTRRAGRLRAAPGRPAAPTRAGRRRLAGLPAAARRPGVRRRDVAGHEVLAEPATDPQGALRRRPRRPGRRLRRVRPAVSGVVDRSGGPLAALLRTVRDDLR